MKKITLALILFSVVTLLIFSCTKKDFHSNQNPNNFSGQTVESTKDNLDKFAQILSKAVANSSALRTFIKEKALEQTDNDYDVIYNFIKMNRSEIIAL